MLTPAVLTPACLSKAGATAGQVRSLASSEGTPWIWPIKILQVTCLPVQCSAVGLLHALT